MSQKPPPKPLSLTHIIPLSEQLFSIAVDSGASDLHLEPHSHFMQVRMRIDGLMQLLEAPFNQLPLAIGAALVTRIKLLSEMDISELRRPQDGSFQWQYQQHLVDVRSSSLAGHWGEKLVLRLQWQQQNTDLTRQGLSLAQLNIVKQKLKNSQGLILVTGPTGSGKTMFLYSCIEHIKAPHINIVSAEDPIEVALNHVHQVAVNTHIDLSFSNILRALLRQDPDVIMLGELRDFDSADVALKASQTGHLLLTSMHTSSVSEAIQRCHGLGMDMLGLSYCLSLIINQRLVRKLCETCKQPLSQTQIRDLETIEWLNAKANYTQCFGPIAPCIAVGCSDCHAGFNGRFGLFDLVEIDQAKRESVAQRNMDLVGLEGGIRQQGLWRVLSGHTTLAELNRVIW